MNTVSLLFLAMLGSLGHFYEVSQVSADTFSPISSRQAEAECVVASQDAGDRSLTVYLRNSCGNAVSCNMSWSTRCGNAPARAGRWSGVIEASGSHDVLVSVQDCREDSWTIQPPVWDCRAKK